MNLMTTLSTSTTLLSSSFKKLESMKNTNKTKSTKSKTTMHINTKKYLIPFFFHQLKHRTANAFQHVLIAPISQHAAKSLCLDFNVVRSNVAYQIDYSAALVNYSLCVVDVYTDRVPRSQRFRYTNESYRTMNNNLYNNTITTLVQKMSLFAFVQLIFTKTDELWWRNGFAHRLQWFSLYEFYMERIFSVS
jgi:hypothetical protein